MSITSMTVGGKIKFKIVMLGDQYVGKSSIIDRFINDKFEETYSATIGIDFLVRNIVFQNRTYRLQLWDTAGQERFKSLIPSYLKDSHAALIVFDLADSQTMSNAVRWLEFYNDHKQLHSVASLVGNKCDLVQNPPPPPPQSDKQKQKRPCTQKQIEDLRKKLQIPYQKISAKTGQGITQLFQNLITLINNSSTKSQLQSNSQSQSQLQPPMTTKDPAQHEINATSTVVLPKQTNINIKLDEEMQTSREVHEMKAPCC